jgi:hypothetical protein
MIDLSEIDSSPGRWVYAVCALGGVLVGAGIGQATESHGMAALILGGVGLLLFATGMLQHTDGADCRRFERRRVALILARRKQENEASR